jgi:hypothetical protein
MVNNKQNENLRQVGPQRGVRHVLPHVQQGPSKAFLTFMATRRSVTNEQPDANTQCLQTTFDDCPISMWHWSNLFLDFET